MNFRVLLYPAAVMASLVAASSAFAVVGACPTDPATGATYNVTGGNPVGGVVFDDACQHVYISRTTSNVVEIRAVSQSDSRTYTIFTGTQPFGLDVSPDAVVSGSTGSGTLYVANTGSNNLSVVDLSLQATWQAPPTITLPQPLLRPVYVAVARNGQVMIATDATGGPIQLYQYDPVTRSFRNRTTDIPGGIITAVPKASADRSVVTGISSPTAAYEYVAVTDGFAAAPAGSTATLSSDGTVSTYDSTGAIKFSATPHAVRPSLALTNVQTGAVFARMSIGNGISAAQGNALTISGDGSLAAVVTTSGFSVINTKPLIQSRFMALSTFGGPSFIRLYNTGVSAGAVSIAVTDSATGVALGTWTSPSIPAGAELQFGIDAIEASLTPTAARPYRYSMALQAPRGFFGYMQYVNWTPSPGTLANLSACDRDVADREVADPYQISGVHSSKLSAGYSSAITVASWDAAGNPAQSVVLTVYDARNGAALGQYTTPAIAGKDQFTITGDQLESAIGITPDAGMLHYVVVARTPFKGYLIHRLTNKQVGVITDMTPACLLNSPLQTADSSGALDAVALQTVDIAGVYSTAQTDTQSFLRISNERGSPQSATVTLNFPGGSRSWISPLIPANGEIQVDLGTIEQQAPGGAFAKPATYIATVSMAGYGHVQHVLYRPTAGTLTNDSTCDANANAPLDALDLNRLTGVHSSLLRNNPSYIVVHNNFAVSASFRLDVFDANTGNLFGTYPTGSVAARGDLVVTVPQIEATLNINPTGTMFHYDIQANTTVTPGLATTTYLQHVVLNPATGLLEDMTKVCRASVTP